MSLHLETDIQNLKKNILALSALVEESVRESVTAFETNDMPLAEKVIARDAEIDRQEIEVEESCLKTLALHQPVAIYLRFIVSVVKINNDLERIGDLAVNIAERTISSRSAPADGASGSFADLEEELEEMGERSRSMLRKSLDALVNLDTALARQVFAEDDAVDAIQDTVLRQVKERIAADRSHLDTLMSMLFVSRHLERIADLATNIAEDVVYMIEGRIVRHGGIPHDGEGDLS